MAALKGAVGQKPAVFGAIGLGRKRLGTFIGVGDGPISIPSMSCGTSSKRAHSPIALREPGVGTGTALVAWHVKTSRTTESVGRYRLQVRRRRLLCQRRLVGVVCHRRRATASVGIGSLQQVGAYEAVKVAVEHPVSIAHFKVRAVILDHRVRMQHARADLGTEVDVLGLRPSPAQSPHEAVRGARRARPAWIAASSSPRRGLTSASARSGTARRRRKDGA